MRKIGTMEQLKRENEDDGGDFFILLNGGLRSSKWIKWIEDEKIFCVVNESDGTVQELTEMQIMDAEHTLVGEAIGKGALFEHEY